MPAEQSLDFSDTLEPTSDSDYISKQAGYPVRLDEGFRRLPWATVTETTWITHPTADVERPGLVRMILTLTL